MRPAMHQAAVYVTCLCCATTADVIWIRLRDDGGRRTREQAILHSGGDMADGWMGPRAVGATGSYERVPYSNTVVVTCGPLPVVATNQYRFVESIPVRITNSFSFLTSGF